MPLQIFMWGLSELPDDKYFKSTPFIVRWTYRKVYLGVEAPEGLFTYILSKNWSAYGSSRGNPAGMHPCMHSCMHAFLGMRACLVCVCALCTQWGGDVIFLDKNCMWRGGRKQTCNQIEVGRGGEMRLQLIMGLAADVPHESNSLQPVCFRGNRISNYWAWALPPPFSQQGRGWWIWTIASPSPALSFSSSSSSFSFSFFSSL